MRVRVRRVQELPDRGMFCLDGTEETGVLWALVLESMVPEERVPDVERALQSEADEIVASLAQAS